MKTEKNILIAFILNILFAIFEFFGGLLTNSIAIISDSVHDIADALSIGLSYILERISKKQPDDKYTYGYKRYSLLGATITTVILITGSILVIINSIKRFINLETINYNGMIVFAIIGVIVNFFAAYYTHKGESLNERTVSLHMLEDVLGWLIVLIGALIMKFTNLNIIDPILSILVSLYILYNAYKNLKIIIDLFLEKTPSNINIEEIKKEILNIKNIKDVHHIHIWSMDGYVNYATIHIVVDEYKKNIKDKIRETLKEYEITHVTIEIEDENDNCIEKHCHVESNKKHFH
ncbi:MAG: cation transporter [Bacilli bacterium]|nr:cation transporter [Bacilli bacterium]